MAKNPLIIGGVEIRAGSETNVDLPLANMYTHTPLTMPVRVLAGRKPGPVLFVSAAIHGDELNGVEIIRRLLRLPSLKRMRGSLIAVPVVNVPGFLNRSRYLPDRRDLNRSFPGSPSGSLAGRVAHCFIEEIVRKSDCGIDLHTGALWRSNLPQIRTNLSRPGRETLAKAFGAPLVLDSSPAANTLRDFTASNDIPVLLYESGEALRFDESCIRVGVQGIVNVMRELDMLPEPSRRRMRPEPAMATSSKWMRAPGSGMLRTLAALGQEVKKGQVLGYVSDTFGDSEQAIESPLSGLIIGKLNLPVVFEGEAIFHIARTNRAAEIAEEWERFQGIENSPFDDDQSIV